MRSNSCDSWPSLHGKKKRRRNGAGVRIREQSAYKSSETMKPFPPFSLMRPSSGKFGPRSQTFFFFFSHNESAWMPLPTFRRKKGGGGPRGGLSAGTADEGIGSYSK